MIFLHPVVSNHLPLLTVGRMKYKYLLIYRLLFRSLKTPLISLLNPSIYLLIIYHSLSPLLAIYAFLALICHLYFIHSFKYFTNINQLFVTNLRCSYYHNFHFIGEDTKVKIGQVTCPKSHN